MNYDPTKPFEIVFHTIGKYAKVDDFKNIPEWSEVIELIGRENAEKYIENSSISFLKFKSPTDPVFPDCILMTDPQNLSGKAKYLSIHATVTMENMKEIQEKVKFANRRLDRFLVAEGKIKEKEGEQDDRERERELMNYDPTKPSEIVFHYIGTEAKVINFKNVPTNDELYAMYGLYKREKLLSEDGVTCNYVDLKNSPCYISLFRNEKGKRDDEEKFFLWQKYPVNVARNAEELMKQASDHLMKFHENVEKEKEGESHER
jgi:acyl-CoA-binding protein